MEDNSWYYGSLTRIQAVRTIENKHEGAFLIRKSENGAKLGGSVFTLSVKGGERVLHYGIKWNERGKYHIWDMEFEYLKDLVQHYRSVSVSHDADIKLRDCGEFLACPPVFQRSRSLSPRPSSPLVQPRPASPFLPQSQVAPECSICNNPFDNAAHRPRALPCGHGFCTSCVESCISAGSKSCPVCRTEHGAEKAIELPVSFLLEELLQMSTITIQKPKIRQVIEMGSGDMCPKHKRIPLYFHCRSHNIKICHSCVIIDHPASTCNLVSLEEVLQEKKQSQILTVQKQKQVLVDTEKDLKMLLEKNVDFLSNQVKKRSDIEKEIHLLFNDIEQINQSVKRKETSQKQVKEAIQSCRERRRSFETIETNLQFATVSHELEEQFSVAKIEIMKSQQWENIVRMEMNMRKRSVSCSEYVEVERDGIHRSCKVFNENGRAFVPSLSKELNTPISAQLKQEAELCLTSTSTIVFMDLSARRQSLGRIYIRVFSNRTHGAQFIMLALGTTGATYKGSTFSGRYSDCIALWEHVKETGERTHKPIGTELKEENCAIAAKGRIFPQWGSVNSASFVIMTKNGGDLKWPGHFGDVVEGIDVIERASSDEYDITEITITECGIVLDY